MLRAVASSVEFISSLPSPFLAHCYAMAMRADDALRFDYVCRCARPSIETMTRRVRAGAPQCAVREPLRGAHAGRVDVYDGDTLADADLMAFGSHDGACVTMACSPIRRRPLRYCRPLRYPDDASTLSPCRQIRTGAQDVLTR